MHVSVCAPSLIVNKEFNRKVYSEGIRKINWRKLKQNIQEILNASKK